MAAKFPIPRGSSLPYYKRLFPLSIHRALIVRCVWDITSVTLNWIQNIFNLWNLIHKILISFFLVPDFSLLLIKAMQKSMPLKDIFLGQKNYEVLTICQVLIFTTNIKYMLLLSSFYKWRKLKQTVVTCPRSHSYK